MYSETPISERWDLDLYRYRTFWPRFRAAVIDSIVLWPLALLDRYFSSPSRSAAALVSWYFVYIAAVSLYSVMLHARYGQTLGKMVTKVKVMDETETRLPSLRQAILRDIGDIVANIGTLIYLIYLLVVHKYAGGPADQLNQGPAGEILQSATIIWGLLEIFTMLANPKRRALHDFIAKTVVVRLD